MKGEKRRIEKVQSNLSPKPAFQLWMQEAHGFDTVEGYLNHLMTVPNKDWPLACLTSQATEAATQAMKGNPQIDINRAVQQARRDVVFLFMLHQQVNI